MKSPAAIVAFAFLLTSCERIPHLGAPEDPTAEAEFCTLDALRLAAARSDIERKSMAVDDAALALFYAVEISKAAGSAKIASYADEQLEEMRANILEYPLEMAQLGAVRCEKRYPLATKNRDIYLPNNQKFAAAMCAIAASNLASRVAGADLGDPRVEAYERLWLSIRPDYYDYVDNEVMPADIAGVSSANEDAAYVDYFLDQAVLLGRLDGVVDGCQTRFADRIAPAEGYLADPAASPYDGAEPAEGAPYDGAAPAEGAPSSDEPAAY